MRLTVERVGDFYEVFDWDTKETLFVSEKSRLALNEMVRIKKMGKSVWYEQMATPSELEKGH